MIVITVPGAPENEIQKLIAEGHSYSDCVILQRTNAQTRVMEEMLLRAAIPYRVLGGLRFYDRKEIKDIIAYLRVILNPNDSASLRRIINEPKRSIGLTTIQKLMEIGEENSLSLYQVILHVHEYPELLKAESKLLAFYQMIEQLRAEDTSMNMTDFLEEVLDKTQYIESLKAQHSIEAETRIENIKEFLSVTREYDARGENGGLAEFLEGVALVSDIDNYNEDEDTVALMTMHSAKGLEFPVVFLVGMEDGLFPSFRSIGNDELEEERRLCYVAITRAKKKLVMTYANNRILFGSSTHNMPSRFLKEIPVEFLEEKKLAPRPKKEDVKARLDKERMEEYNRFKHSIFKSSKNETKIDDLSYQKGDRVEHRKFGKGTILSIMPMGNDCKLEINFDNEGVKNLMAVHAKLKRL